MPNNPANAWEDHLKERLTADTVFFDHDVICDTEAKFPHTLPSEKVWVTNMKKLGIQKSHEIICYDNQGMFSVARAAWMFDYFGSLKVRVLNGGLKKWKLDKLPTVLDQPQEKAPAQV